MITHKQMIYYASNTKNYHLKSAEILLRKILTTAGADPLITYTEIADQTKRDRRNEVPYDVGTLSLICNELDLPMISVLVVGKQKNKIYNKYMAGDGFYDLWRDKYNDSTLNDLEIFDLELKRVKECKDWWKLEKHLKLKNRIFSKDYIPVSQVTCDEIGKNYNFEYYDIDKQDISLSKYARAERTKRHQELVRKISLKLSENGYRLYEGIMDCAAVKTGNKPLLIEVKTLAEDKSDELHQVRQALGQLLYYEEFHIYQIPGINYKSEIIKIAYFEHKISNQYIDFLSKFNCYTLWLNEITDVNGIDNVIQLS